LLEAGRLKYYPTRDEYEGGWGHPSIGVIIDIGWVEKHFDKLSIDGRNLAHLLVHEIEHFMGRQHVGHGTAHEDRYNTPNSNNCSGLSAPK
jgi:hypothetical protein